MCRLHLRSPIWNSISSRIAYHVNIGRDTHLLLPNKQYTDIENAKQLLQRKSMIGILSMRDNNIGFSIRSTSQPGGFPIVIEGDIIDRELRFRSAESSPSERISKQPKKST